MPERQTCLRHEARAGLPDRSRFAPRMLGVERRECGERLFERAADPTERRCLLLPEFVIEEGSG